MLRSVLALALCSGCLAPIPTGAVRKQWRDVEPRTLERGEHTTLFVVTKDRAMVIDALVGDGVVRGQPSATWQLAPHQRIVIRDEEPPQSTAQRNRWKPDAVTGPVTIRFGEVRHASTPTDDVASNLAFLGISIGLLAGVLVVAGATQ